MARFKKNIPFERNKFGIKIRKIDSRNRLHGIMEYQLRIPLDMFLEVREWCWETWGGSVEYILYDKFKGKQQCNNAWCFDADISTTKFPERNRDLYRTGLVYLASDAELDLFFLKWAQDV